MNVLNPLLSFGYFRLFFCSYNEEHELAEVVLLGRHRPRSRQTQHRTRIHRLQALGALTAAMASEEYEPPSWSAAGGYQDISYEFAEGIAKIAREACLSPHYLHRRFP